jgi:hypothetical protein
LYNHIKCQSKKQLALNVSENLVTPGLRVPLPRQDTAVRELPDLVADLAPHPVVAPHLVVVPDLDPDPNQAPFATFIKQPLLDVSTILLPQLDLRQDVLYSPIDHPRDVLYSQTDHPHQRDCLESLEVGMSTEIQHQVAQLAAISSEASQAAKAPDAHGLAVHAVNHQHIT